MDGRDILMHLRATGRGDYDGPGLSLSNTLSKSCIERQNTQMRRMKEKGSVLGS